MFEDGNLVKDLLFMCTKPSMAEIILVNKVRKVRKKAAEDRAEAERIRAEAETMKKEAEKLLAQAEKKQLSHEF